MLHHRQGLDGFRRIAERGTRDKVRFHPGLPLAVIARDADGTFAEAYVGERDQGHPHAALRRHAKLFENLPIRARLFVEQHADRDRPAAGFELCKRRADIADGRDPDGLRQALGRYAQTHGQIPARVDSQLRPIERGSRQDIGDHRKAPHLGGQLGRHVRDRGIVLAGHDESDVALAVLVEEPVTDIRYFREI